MIVTASALITLMSAPSTLQANAQSAAAIRDCAECPAITPIANRGGKDPASPILMTVYPITWHEYLVAVRAANCKLPANLNGKPVDITRANVDDDHPVTGVIVDDFACYINWLNRASGKTYRLPTPAEWLAAARTAPARIEHWDIMDRGNAVERSRNDPREAISGGIIRPVGLGKPSSDGVFDLEGNGGEATSESRPGPNKKICDEYGQRYCRAVVTFGFDAADASKPYRTQGLNLQGYPQIALSYRLVRNSVSAAPPKEKRR